MNERVVETKPELTKKEIYDNISSKWDFEALMKPYQEGGTESSPVVCTWGIVIDWLHVKKKYPIHVIGQAIMVVMDQINTHGHLKGDGSYGSAADRFQKLLQITCESIVRNRRKKDVLVSIGRMRSADMSQFIAKMVYASIPWWVKALTWNYWKFRKVVRNGSKKRG